MTYAYVYIWNYFALLAQGENIQNIEQDLKRKNKEEFGAFVKSGPQSFT